MKSSKEFLGKVVLVTGAARGIGLGIARRFAEEGARVFIADINRERGETASSNLRHDGLLSDFMHIDLSLPGSASAMVAKAFELGGKLDVLVNNARAGNRLRMLDETEENWNLALMVNLTAAFFASQAAIRLMTELGGCRIVNVASVAASQVTLESPSYHASKAGLLHLTKYLAVFGGEFGTHVNGVLPGLIVQEEHRSRFHGPDNEIYKALATHYQPLNEVGTERNVADAILYLCSSRASYVSGTCITVDGGATAQEPFGLLQSWRTSRDEY